MSISFQSLNLGGEYDRPYLSEIWGYESHHAISRGVVTPKDSRYIILFVTKEKQRAFTQYQDFLEGDILHWEGEERHGSDDRIVKAKEVGDQIHLFYRERHHSPFSYLGEIILTHHEIRNQSPSRFTFRLLRSKSKYTRDPFRDVREHRTELEGLGITESEAIIQSRVGQGRFRKDILALWGGCAVTGISDDRVLVASHVKPWSVSNNNERLDPLNGLALIPNLDALFDVGLITFDCSGSLKSSQFIDSQTLGLLGIKDGMKLRVLPEGLEKYMSYHRQCVFKEKW